MGWGINLHNFTQTLSNFSLNFFFQKCITFWPLFYTEDLGVFLKEWFCRAESKSLGESPLLDPPRQVHLLLPKFSICASELHHECTCILEDCVPFRKPASSSLEQFLFSHLSMSFEFILKRGIEESITFLLRGRCGAAWLIGLKT